MGLLDNIRGVAPTPPKAMPEISAGVSPLQPALWGYDNSSVFISRQRAVSVPSVSRARNLICSTIGGLPIKRWAVNGNRELPPIPLQYQPDPSCPKSVTYAWLADSMLFYGIGYLQVLEVYSEDQRPSRWRWIDPLRINLIMDSTGTIVTGYEVDGVKAPDTGVGRIIAFPAPDEGLLYRNARTIETAIELEEASNRAAKEPMPNVVLKNKGADLPGSQVNALMDAWKASRRTRSAAYVNDSIDVQALSFSPEQQQLVSARQFHVSEVARAVGIPAWYLNAEAASMTYTNVTSERRALIDFSIRPIMIAIEERMSANDVIARDLAFRFDLDNFLRGNPMEQVDVAIKLMDAGIITDVDAREMLDIVSDGGN